MGTLQNRLKFGCILLAAGTGSRMKSVDKLLLEINNISLIEKSYRLYKDMNLQPVVVTGFCKDRITSALDKEDPVFVHNANFLEGQQTSVMAGLAALKDDYDAVIIALADMPLLTPNDISEIKAAYAMKPSLCSAVIPYDGYRRGNPVVIDAGLIPCILKEGAGVRSYLDRNPDQILWHMTNSPGYYIDVDTVDDLNSLQVTYGLHIKPRTYGQS